MSEFFSCNNKDLTPEQLLSALVTKTTEGEWAIRTMQVEACAEDAIDCSNIKGMDAYSIIKKCIGVSECGKPAIRLALPSID